MSPPPKIPWQVTGNHWISLPCIHPADASIHALGVVVRRRRGAVEFSGGPAFADGTARPLLQIGLEVNGASVDLSNAGIAWQRISEWIPTFHAFTSGLTVRGTVVGPYGRGIDGPGVIYLLSFENQTAAPVTIRLTPNGTLGHRQYRIQTPRAFDDAHAYTVGTSSVTLSGASAVDGAALAIGLDEGIVSAQREPDGSISWSIARELVIGPRDRIDVPIYMTAAPEPDGASAALGTLRRRGWKIVVEGTYAALTELERQTGTPTVDRLINRHLMFAYFFGVARAIDDAQLYPVYTRSPWNAHGMTVRDWTLLMWTIPAIQLADPDLGRELIIRMCEVHGYAPGRGVNYLDGVPFEMAFSLEGAASYVMAIDRYISQTGDDRIVEEHIVADTLYASYEDISARRDAHQSLFTTDYTLSGRVELPYVLHANAVVAYALTIFKETLDEKTAENVESAELVRSAIQRQFLIEGDKNKGVLATAIDLSGNHSSVDDPVGSVYWLPVYDMVSRTNGLYRRTTDRYRSSDGVLSAECARLLGPDAAAVLDRLRRATMDNGVAAEVLDERGNAVENGGDAALSGLIAATVWYAVTVLGVRL